MFGSNFFFIHWIESDYWIDTICTDDSNERSKKHAMRQLKTMYVKSDFTLILEVNINFKFFIALLMNPWYLFMLLIFKKLWLFCVKLCKKQTPKVCDLIIIILLL